MGVILKRAGLAALVLLAVLLPLRRSAEEVRGSGPDLDWELRLHTLTRDLWKARVRWTALSERDSALALLAGIGAPGQSPSIRLQGFPAGARAFEAESSLARLWKRLGPADTSVGVILLAYNQEDFGSNTWWNIFSGNLITTQRGLTWCVAVAPASLRPDGRLLVGRSLLEDVIAPCALLAAFGPPGPGVKGWLDATGYTAARSNGWIGKPKEYVEGQGEGPWMWLEEWIAAAQRRPSGPALSRTVTGLQIATLLSPPYYYGAPAVRCLDGQEDSCAESVLRPVITQTGAPDIPSDLSVNNTLLGGWAMSLTSARPPAKYFLSDLARDQGREEFRAFWKSELPFEQAFEQAFKEPLGVWTSRWAQRQWQATWAARYRSRTIILGSDLDASWPFVALLWTAIALGIVASAARRRQVT